MSMTYIRKTYGVPAKRGGRIEYTGEGPDKPELGTITSARGGRLMIRLDKYPRHPMPFHPTWELRYLDGKRTRFAVGYVGEDGIEDGVAYVVRNGKLSAA